MTLFKTRSADNGKPQQPKVLAACCLLVAISQAPLAQSGAAIAQEAAKLDQTMESERERLNRDLLNTAALVQQSEAELSAIETRLRELDVQKKTAQSELAASHSQIVKLLSALQRMGRNPPPVMVTKRKDALGMVRSAMLLSATFPELKDQALALNSKLERLASVKEQTQQQADRLRAKTKTLKAGREQLAHLMKVKKTSLVDHQSHIREMRRASADIARDAQSLTDLITRLDKTVAARTPLGAYEAANPPAPAEPDEIELAAAEPKQELEETGPPVPLSGQAPSTGVLRIEPDKPAASSFDVSTDTSEPEATNDKDKAATESPDETTGPEDSAKSEIQVATVVKPDLKPRVVEMAPKAAAFQTNPGRMKPMRPFVQSRGLLPMPAHGTRILDFGDRTQFGGNSKGIVLETRYGAQVTSPTDGWVVWSGKFRSYGQLLIINAGDGYHILLAGLSQIDVEPGQFLLASEPVGTMTTGTGSDAGSVQGALPVLYIEFRKQGRPIDPGPWWASGQQKVQG